MADGLFAQNTVVSNDLPAWYQQYTQNLAGTAQGLAQNLNGQPLPAKSVAGFNPTQTAAFDLAGANTGAWQPNLTAASAAYGAAAPAAMGFANRANEIASGPTSTTSQAGEEWANKIIGSAGSSNMAGGYADAASKAVAGTPENWTENYQKYMSPYTSEVVDNIGRLGKRQWENTIMPGVNSSMIGAGQFGSTRNADILTRAGLESNMDIMGQQSNALQSGYKTAADIFGSDANRLQTQGQLQSQAALGGGNLAVNEATANANRAATAAQSAGALAMQSEIADANRRQAAQQAAIQAALSGGTLATGALTSAGAGLLGSANATANLNNGDVNSLLTTGGLQQALQQRGYDTAYDNATTARTDPWTQMSNLQSLLNGLKLPTQTTTATSGQGGVPPTAADSIGSGLAGLAALLKEQPAQNVIKLG